MLKYFVTLHTIPTHTKTCIGRQRFYGCVLRLTISKPHKHACVCTVMKWFHACVWVCCVLVFVAHSLNCEYLLMLLTFRASDISKNHFEWAVCDVRTKRSCHCGTVRYGFSALFSGKHLPREGNLCGVTIIFEVIKVANGEYFADRQFNLK